MADKKKKKKSCNFIDLQERRCCLWYVEYNVIIKQYQNKTKIDLYMGGSMRELSNFFNEKMKVMIVINEHLIEVDGEKFCPLNQNEIASLIPCGKVKANQIIKELIKEGYIDKLRIKGRYRLTGRGREVLNMLQ